LLSLSFVLCVALRFFPNIFFFVFVLLILALTLILWLVTSRLVPSLLGLIFVLVYVGAIIILIVYTCAVCPNFVSSPRFSPLFLALTAVLPAALPSSRPALRQARETPLNFFYSLAGYEVLATIALAMFVVLIVVTSSLASPFGPIRAVSQ
jgi:hypothetical protein